MACEDKRKPSIRTAVIQDARAIASIYNHYIKHTVATFEEEILPVSEIVERMRSVEAVKLPWLVAELNGSILGYSYTGKWRPRSAYRFSVEATVYVAPELGGQGIGSALYETLLASLRELEIHTVIGGISLPNDASVALHEKFGFKKVAHFVEVGFKFSRWVDVGYWELSL